MRGRNGPRRCSSNPPQLHNRNAADRRTVIIFMVSNSGAILSPGRDGLSGISPNSGSRVSKLLFLPPPSPFTRSSPRAVLSGLAVVKWWHKATAMPSVASSRLGGLIYREDTADDGGDLFLGGGTAPRDALLDAHRGVFRNGWRRRQRSCHSYALRPPEFEHRLHVFAEEGRFQRHFARGVLVKSAPPTRSNDIRSLA